MRKMIVKLSLAPELKSIQDGMFRTLKGMRVQEILRIDFERGIKMAVVDRYTGEARTGKGFVTGLGLGRGAIASSVAHDSHNIIVAGTADADMQAAVTAVAEMNGGFAAACDGAVLARLPLPVAGLMSDRPVETVRDQLDGVIAAARQLGANLSDPFMTLGFLALPVIPDLKLTDRGLVDVTCFDVVPLFV